jgi:hypothetical protein
VLWDLGVGMLILYSCVSVPVRIGFALRATAGSTATDAVVDFCFALDMALAFRTAYINDEG